MASFDRLGNLNADAAANKAQLSAAPSLTHAADMVARWKERIQQYRELLAMLLVVSKAAMNRQKGILHEMANPIEKPWSAKRPRAKSGLDTTPV